MAVMIGQAMYWQNIAKKSGKQWFYVTADEWFDQTGLTKEQQITARKKMVAFDFWQEELKGNPAKMHYRVDVKCLLFLIEKFIETGKPVISDKRTEQRENTRTSNGKFRQQVAVNYGNREAVNYGDYNTEIKKDFSDSEPSNLNESKSGFVEPLKDSPSTQKENVPPPPAAKFPAAWVALIDKAAKRPPAKMQHSSERVWEIETPDEIAGALIDCSKDELFLDNFKRNAGRAKSDTVLDLFTAFLERRLIEGEGGYQNKKQFRSHLLNFPAKYLFVKQNEQPAPKQPTIKAPQIPILR